MKGGRTAPRNAGRGDSLFGYFATFNEGGADCPPKPEICDALEDDWGPSMKGGRTAPRNLVRGMGIGEVDVLQ